MSVDLAALRPQLAASRLRPSQRRASRGLAEDWHTVRCVGLYDLPPVGDALSRIAAEFPDAHELWKQDD